jgi:MFS family permease
MDPNTSPPQTWRPGVTLALVCLPVFIGALDLTIVSAVLPNVILDLQIPFPGGADEAAWVVSGYLLAYTVSVAVMGRVSDIIGRRRTYFISLLIFILGSWWVASAVFAPADWTRRVFRMLQGGRPDTAYMKLYALIAGRVVQALGAGAMVPVSMALVGDLYPPARRPTALGVVGAVDTAGWVLGHLYGGLMVQVVDWPVLFWINIPITAVVALLTWWQLAPVARSRGEGGLGRPALMALVAAMVAVNALALVALARAAAPAALDAPVERLLDQNWLAILVVLLMLASLALTLASARRVEGASRPNWPATALIALALIGLNVGLGGSSESGTGQSLADTPPLPPYAYPVLAGAAAAFIAFVLLERRSRHPLFALEHFQDRNVSLSTGINLLVGFCLMVGLVSVPLFVNTVIATTPEEGALVGGILLGALTIPMALSSVPGGLLTQRAGYRVPTAFGLALAAIGFSLGRTWTPDVAHVTMGWHMALAGVGLGLTIAPVGTAVINAVRADERGIASALVLVMRLVGMTVSTSVMTRYGLRRSTILTTQHLAALGDAPDYEALVQVSLDVATRVINEMLVIAAVVALVAVIPALFLRPHDRPTEQKLPPG